MECEWRCVGLSNPWTVRALGDCEGAGSVKYWTVSGVGKVSSAK